MTVSRFVTFEGLVADAETVTGDGAFIVAASPTIENFGLATSVTTWTAVSELTPDRDDASFTLALALETSDDGGGSWRTLVTSEPLSSLVDSEGVVVMSSKHVPESALPGVALPNGPGELLRVTVSVTESGHQGPGAFRFVTLSGSGELRGSP